MLYRAIPTVEGAAPDDLHTGRDFVPFDAYGEPERDGAGWVYVVDAPPEHPKFRFEPLADAGCVDVVERNDPRIGGYTKGRITETVVQAKLGEREAEYVRTRMKRTSRWLCNGGTYYVLRPHAPPPPCGECEGGGKFFTVKGTEVTCATCDGTGVLTETAEDYEYDEPSEFEDYNDPPGYGDDW